MNQRENEEVERKLCVAAIRGDVDSLHEILELDELILERAVAGYSTISPLHIAALYNRTEFLQELLNKCPFLTRMLNSQYQTALHLASMGGCKKVVLQLVSARPDMCLACDKDGMNPLHVAAIEGHIEVLEILYIQRPYAAKSRVNGGDGILHLCVRYNQFPSFKLLLLMAGSEFVNAEDGSGNTVLHLAVSENRLEMVQYLLDPENNIKMDVNATNLMGQTSLDIIILAKRKRAQEHAQEEYIHRYLLKAGAITSYVEPQKREWLSGKKDAIMVVASLIATMAFQAIVSPPGGVWQADTTNYKAGEAVMAYNYPEQYPIFLRLNTMGFVASLTTILLLLTGSPVKRRVYMFILVVLMWFSISMMALAYVVSVTVLTPAGKRAPLSRSLLVGIVVWIGMMVFYLTFHTALLIRSVVQEDRMKINPIQRPSTVIEYLLFAKKFVMQLLFPNSVVREANCGIAFLECSTIANIVIPESSTPSGIDISKSFTGSGIDIPEYSTRSRIDIPESSTRSGIDISKSSTGKGIDIPESSTRSGIDISMYSTGSGIDIPESSTRSRIDIPDSSTRSGIDIPESSTGKGIDIPESSTRSRIDIPESSTVCKIED